MLIYMSRRFIEGKLTLHRYAVPLPFRADNIASHAKGNCTEGLYHLFDTKKRQHTAISLGYKFIIGA